MTVRRVEVPAGHGLGPWSPTPIDLVHYRLEPTKIHIQDVNDDGSLNYESTERFRVVGNGDNWLDITDDWDEADRIMGIKP
jgi:hypothetical protein